jgi:alkanesulfonate monooxygenase SsuD/methylene tetrahydromethanopterin reductase-like flavin-dependent oxidoreductase (luciferase family)
MSRLRSALWLPLFGDLADPRVVVRLAAEAEAAGWDGCFVWDQLCWRAPVRPIADPWIVLAAMATATERLRLGPMVSPLPRRRPAKVARETATLDQLSDGRLILGVGIGSDRFGAELSKTGEELDDRRRGRMLDESLAVLASAWSGEAVHHHGEHYLVDNITFLPAPVQPQDQPAGQPAGQPAVLHQPARRPTVPVWAAGFPGNAKPIRRAARLDGFFPANLERPDQLAEIVATVTALRSGVDGSFDVAIGLPVGVDPLPYAAVGATWWLPEFEPGVPLDTVRGVLRDGPASPGGE